MFVGSCPGAGKSTLSYLLYRQCVLHHLNVEWWYEEDVFQFEPVRRFADQMVRGDPAALESFEAGVQHATLRWIESSVLYITDSYLPGFFWLRHLYPDEELRDFSERLWMRLAPLRPLVVYCRADVETAFRRATRQRGDAWGHGISGHVMSWHTPQYPEAPLESGHDVLRFWSWLDRESRRLLERWPGDILTLETTTSSPEALIKQTLDYLELEELPSPPLPSIEQLKGYTGVYTRANESEQAESITIEVRNNSLFATSYWPSGSPLTPEWTDFFRLQSSSRTVKFHRNERDAVTGFTYATTLEGEKYYARQHDTPAEAPD